MYLHIKRLPFTCNVGLLSKMSARELTRHLVGVCSVEVEDGLYVAEVGWTHPEYRPYTVLTNLLYLSVERNARWLYNPMVIGSGLY